MVAVNPTEGLSRDDAGVGISRLWGGVGGGRGWRWEPRDDGE